MGGGPPALVTPGWRLIVRSAVPDAEGRALLEFRVNLFNYRFFKKKKIGVAVVRHNLMSVAGTSK